MNSKLTGGILRSGAWVGGALLSALPLGLMADDAKVDKLEKENQELRKRLDTLEAVAQKEGILPSAAGKPQMVSALSSVSLSGFATASYFYDTRSPGDNSSNGYLWNRNHGSFTLNKVKVTLASKPVERNGENWDAGFRTSLIYGEDAPIVNTGGVRQGFQDLREAFVELNVPLGTGLDIKAGQLISLLNFESGDGGSANPNFSQGNQWFFTGNGPAAGIQFSYALTDWLDVTARVQNGLFTGPVDNNGFKTLMGGFGIKPDSKTSISLLGFGGREGASANQWLKGGSLIASRQLTEKFNINVATELDYFDLDLAAGSADWWSVGGWIWTDLTPKFGLAFRADYIGDGSGAGTSGLLGFAPNTGQDIVSLTLTANYKPVPSVKIQPEIRYDHSSLKGSYDGTQDRFIIGAGISYLF